MENVANTNGAVNVKRDPSICRARRHAAKHGMRMLKQGDRGYKLTRVVYLRGRHQDVTVVERLTPEAIIQMCWWFDELTHSYGRGLHLTDTCWAPQGAKPFDEQAAIAEVTQFINQPAQNVQVN